jgi:predicted transcriptional regulator
LSNSKTDGKTFYLTTEKGKQFLEEYEKLNNLLS